MALTWTSAGAVSAPDALQIRVEQGFAGRVAAGAPAPSRALTDAEVRDNVRLFTTGSSGPRKKPVRSLVLSGVDVARRDGLAAVLDEARGWGIGRVTLHVGHGQREALAGSPLARFVHAAALTVADDADLADVAALLRVPGLHVTAVVVLSEAALGRLSHVVSGLVAVRAPRVTLQWPLPTGDDRAGVPHADRVAPAVVTAVAALEAAGAVVGVKGLPACALGPFASRHTRTANRWYVDADHQGDRALLFQPDVVRFSHPDECRFCLRADQCDGVPEAWWRAGCIGRLHAFHVTNGSSEAP